MDPVVEFRLDFSFEKSNYCGAGRNFTTGWRRRELNPRVRNLLKINLQACPNWGIAESLN